MEITRRKSGFTLLEVLLVIAIIAVLAVIVIIAINPAKQLALARNAQRATDARTILNAVKQYSIDHGGDVPVGITENLTEICALGVANCSGLVDLSALTTGGTYVVDIPTDPRGHCSPNGVCYQIMKSADCIKVVAPNAELGVTISISR